MTLPGETVATGAEIPNDTITIGVMMSAAGYYIGYSDEEGLPWSRESGYFASYEEAAEAFAAGQWHRD
jgi:hypothetical protein